MHSDLPNLPKRVPHPRDVFVFVAGVGGPPESDAGCPIQAPLGWVSLTPDH